MTDFKVGDTVKIVGGREEEDPPHKGTVGVVKKIDKVDGVDPRRHSVWVNDCGYFAADLDLVESAPVQTRRIDVGDRVHYHGNGPYNVPSCVGRTGTVLEVVGTAANVKWDDGKRTNTNPFLDNLEVIEYEETTDEADSDLEEAGVWLAQQELDFLSKIIATMNTFLDEDAEEDDDVESLPSFVVSDTNGVIAGVIKWVKIGDNYSFGYFPGGA